MAEPKKKRPPQRSRRARANQKIDAIALIQCGHCQAMIASHTVCPHCGYYKGTLSVSS
ncbi:50S ribosomal protein L32 [Candidatus Berkelbacteria bacterium]|nr:50S ribosomal protein L32 [Candidatus Berkelbacteria bacterium]